MKIPYTLTRVALALGVAIAPILAQEAKATSMDAPRRIHAAGRDEACVRRLKLTQAQQEAIRDIRAKHQEALKAKGDEARKARLAFHEAMAKAETPADQLRALHRSMADSQFELMLARREMKQAIHQLLTPEQREEAARMEGLMAGRRMAHHGFEGGEMGKGERPMTHRNFNRGEMGSGR